MTAAINALSKCTKYCTGGRAIRGDGAERSRMASRSAALPWTGAAYGGVWRPTKAADTGRVT